MEIFNYSWRDQAGRYVTIALGSMIGAMAINVFFVPHHLLSGGIAGMALMVHYLTGWPIGVLNAVLNVPLFYAAYRLLNKSYCITALYGTVIFTVAIDATRDLALLNIVDDTMLAAIYGGIIAGIGSGMVFRVDGSSGGTDIIGAIVKKYYDFNISYVGFALNCILMSVAAFLFGFKLAMFTLVAMYTGTSVSARVIEGFNTKKTVLIVSDYPEEMADALMKSMGRGATFYYGQGAFTRADKKILFIVVTLIQVAKMKPIVNAVDPNAFMIVQDAVEVRGHGFTLPKNNQMGKNYEQDT
ncbi:MAG: putative 5xTM rane YitT family [Firmicutes bacterium]|nr:putative 5xTM rane YitT family [Bacillota bacterium]